MITLGEARERIGDGVVYHLCGGSEEGTITSVNDRFAFVRYGSDRTSEATRPEDLSFLAAASGPVGEGR